MVKIGQKVNELVHFGDERPRPMTGTVVWIHPAGRFYVLEFQLGNEKIRESYFPEEGER